jgi:hypothetical protein
LARGKYDGIVDRLPTLVVEEPSYQDKIDIRKKELVKVLGDKMSSGRLADLYKKFRLEKQELENELFDRNLDLAATTQILVDQFEIDGISSIQLDTGDSVSLRYEPYAVVEDKEKIWQWCKDHGYEREMQLSWQTLNAITKDRLLKGEAEPDGVKAFTKVKPVYYKG